MVLAIRGFYCRPKFNCLPMQIMILSGTLRPKKRLLHFNSKVQHEYIIGRSYSAQMHDEKTRNSRYDRRDGQP